MYRGDFLIYTSKEKFIPIRGYIGQFGNYWYGVYKLNKEKIWKSTELSTGLAIANHKTIKDAKEFLTDEKHMKLIDTLMRSSDTNGLDELKKELKNEYLDPKYDGREKLAKTFYNIYGNEN